MPWKANLKFVEVADGVATIAMTFSNGKNVFDKYYKIGSPGDDFIRKQAAQEIRNLEALDAFAAASPPGPIDISGLGPTPEEIAASIFFDKLRKLNNLKDSVAKKLSSADRLPQLEADVKAAFREEYTSDQRWQK